jgi:hypothetical protein
MNRKLMKFIALVTVIVFFLTSIAAIGIPIFLRR